MAIKRVYKSTISSCQYFFTKGKQAAFVDHKYMTDIESEIAELDAEIGTPGVGKSLHPHLYVDLDEAEVDTEALSPIEIIRAEERKKILAEMAAAAANGDRDMGTTAKLDPTAGMSNSKTVGQAMAGSDSAVSAASTAAPTSGVTLGSIKAANTSPQ